MHRTLIQLDEPLYEQLRHLAFERGQSLSKLIRDLLARTVQSRPSTRKRKIHSLKFVGSGRSSKKLSAEKHDDYLAEDLK